MVYLRKNLSFTEYVAQRLEDVFGGDEPEDIYEAEQKTMGIIDEYYDEPENPWFLDEDDDDDYEDEDEESFLVELIKDEK